MLCVDSINVFTIQLFALVNWEENKSLDSQNYLLPLVVIHNSGSGIKMQMVIVEVVMFGLYPVCRVLSLEVVEYSLSCRVLTLVYFSKLVEYSP